MYKIGLLRNKEKSQLEKNGLKVYLLDDVEIIEEPIEPTMEAIEIECQHYDYSEEELKTELDEAIQNYKEELKTYNSAKKNGFVNGIVFHTSTSIRKDR